MMGVLFIATAFSWRNSWTHLVLGSVLAVAVAAHLWLHRQWLIRQARRMVSPGDKPLRVRTRLDLLVDMSIGAMFIVSAISGAVILLSDGPLWTGLHSVSSWSVFLGFIVHLSSHAGWVVRNARKAISVQPA